MGSNLSKVQGFSLSQCLMRVPASDTKVMSNFQPQKQLSGESIKTQEIWQGNKTQLR